MSSITVRQMTTEDWPQVETIYQEGIDTGHTTFDPQPPTHETFDARRIPELSFVAVDNGHVVGWVAAYETSTRPMYRGVIEHSIYIARAARNQGVGKLLLTELITRSEAAGHWMIQSVIFPENKATLRLHSPAGFRVVGRRERIAYMGFGPMAGQWRDTYLIERRSSIT